MLMFNLINLKYSSGLNEVVIFIENWKFIQFWWKYKHQLFMLEMFLVWFPCNISQYSPTYNFTVKAMDIGFFYFSTQNNTYLSAHSSMEQLNYAWLGSVLQNQNHPGRILIQRSVSKFKLTCSLFQRLPDWILFLLVTEKCCLRILAEVFTLFFFPTKSQAAESSSWCSCVIFYFIITLSYYFTLILYPFLN